MSAPTATMHILEALARGAGGTRRRSMALNRLTGVAGLSVQTTIALLGRLESNQLVSREGHGWRITAAGRAAAEVGAHSRRVRRPDNLRARLWAALRRARKGTVHELVQIAARDGEAACRSGGLRPAADYLRALERAGYCRALPRRQITPSGGRRKVYLLIDDPGPHAPRWTGRARSLVDPNRGEVVHV
ncbi:MAG: hypothetical protein ACE5GS_16760 [Kiloniellaceae bacterium]